MSRLLLNSVATPLYIYFAVLVMPRRVANAKLLFIFGTALEQIAVRHRFAHSKILKNSKNAAFFVLLPNDVTQLSLIQKFFI